MKQIIVKTQSELDAITRIEVDQEVIIKTALQLNCELEVFGCLRLEASLGCSFSGRYVVARENSSVEAWGNSSVVARGNSSVEAWGNSSVVAWGNSSVVAMENSSVEAWGNSSVVARGNSSVVAWENSSVVAWGNSSVVARGNSSVVAMGNSSVEAWGNSSVVARGNSSVVARGQAIIRIIAKIKKLSLHGFSILSLPFDLEFNFDAEKTCLIQRHKPQKYLDREGIEAKDNHVILFKRVSQDFKTQEGYAWETTWKPGKTITHSNWKPEENECGAGKFHACSRPYFCDEFRNDKKDDRYIAIQIAEKDLFEWPNPSYPHKIAFRSGKVLYECDRFGKKK